MITSTLFGPHYKFFNRTMHAWFRFVETELYNLTNQQVFTTNTLAIFPYFSPSTVGSNVQVSSYKKLKSLRFIGC